MKNVHDDLYGYARQDIERESADIFQEVYNILDDDGVKKSKNKKKKKKRIWKKLLIFIILLIGATGIGYFSYVKIYMTAERFLDNTLKEIESWSAPLANYFALSNREENPNNTLGHMTTDFKFTSNVAEYQNFTNLNFIFDGYWDWNQDVAFLALDINNLEEDYLYGDIYINNKTVHYNLPDIYDNVLYSTSEDNIMDGIADSDILANISSQALYGLVNNGGKFLANILKNSDVRTSYSQINVIYEYSINESNKEEIANIINQYISDDGVFSFFESLLNNDWQVESQDIPNINIKLEVNIFTRKVDIIDIVVDDELLHGTRINDNKYRFVDEADDYIDLEIYDNRFTMSINVDDKTDTQLQINMENERIDVTLIAIPGKMNLVLEKINNDEESIKFDYTFEDITFNFDLTNKMEDNNIFNTGSITWDLTGSYLTLEFDNKLNFEEQVPIKVYEDAVKVDSLQEEDYNVIADNLTTLLNNLPYSPLSDILLLLIVQNGETNGESTI